jgi:PAS domain S-box-containing protein
MASRNDRPASADPRRDELRPLLDLSPVAMLVTELETGRIVAMNAQAERIFGVHEADALGRTTLDLHFWRSPDRRGHFKDLIRSNAGEAMVDVEIVKPDGSPWYGMLGSRVLDDGICPTLLVSSILDVTERRQAERARLASEKRVERIVQSLSEGVMATDMSGTILQANKRAHEILGIPDGHLAGRDIFGHANTFLKADGAVMAREEEPGYLTLQDGKPRFNVDIGLVKPDGRSLWINASYSILEWDDALLPRIMLVSFFDITEQHAAQEDVRRSEARLREIADMSQDMLSRHDLQGVCLWASPSCRTFLGVGPDELIGRNAYDFIVPEDYPVLQAGQESLYRLGKFRLQYRIRHADGTILWVETLWALTRDKDGNPLEIHCSTRDISEHKRQNDLLEETQRLARLGGWVLDMESNDNMWTKELKRIYGIPPDAPVPPLEEFLGRMDEHSRRLVEESNARLRADGTPWSLVLKTSSKDGSPLYLRSSCKAERRPDGSIRLLRGTSQDVTDQELMRQRLESASRLNQSILSTTEALVVLLDLDGRVVRFNEACQKLSGWSESELLGSSFVDRLVPQDAREGVRAAFAELVRNPVPTRRESSWTARDGRLLRISWADSVILDDSGSPSYILRTGIDVTEKRKTESVVETLVRRTSSLFGQAFFDALARDLATLLEVRAAFVAHLDESGTRVRTISFCMDGELVDPWESAIAGTPYERTIREGLLFHPSGVCVEYPDAACLRAISAESFLAIPLRNAGGAAIGILGVADTSPLEGGELARSILTIFAGRAQGELERLDAEQALRRMNEELERRVDERTAELLARNREIESFSYSVSHDLRSPLRSINGFAQALDEDCAEQVGEQGREYIARIRKASSRMADLIDDLLSLSQSSRRELRRRDVDLSTIADEILETLRTNEPERSVHCDIQPALHAQGDPILLRAVMENLLGNAWKYTRQARQPAIAFRSEAKDGGFVRFAVVDNGAGFDMAYAQKLFGTFQRLHGAEEFEGNGIGLATAKRIIERHGGSIQGFGEIGKGAKFVFSLPDRS